MGVALAPLVVGSRRHRELERAIARGEPAKLGGFTMVSSPQDVRANGAHVKDAPAALASTFSFDQPLTLLTIRTGWCSSNWAGGVYAGRIYDVLQNTVKITLPHR